MCAKYDIQTSGPTDNCKTRYSPDSASNRTDSRLNITPEITAPPAAANASGAHVALRRGKTGAEFCCVHNDLAPRELGPARMLLHTELERRGAVARRESA